METLGEGKVLIVNAIQLLLAQYIQQKSVIGLWTLLKTSPKTINAIVDMGGWGAVFKAMYPTIFSDEILRGLDLYMAHVGEYSPTSHITFLLMVWYNRRLKLAMDVVREATLLPPSVELREMRQQPGQQHELVARQPIIQLDATRVRAAVYWLFRAKEPVGTVVIDLLAQPEDMSLNPFYSVRGKYLDVDIGTLDNLHPSDIRVLVERYMRHGAGEAQLINIVNVLKTKTYGTSELSSPIPVNDALIGGNEDGNDKKTLNRDVIRLLVQRYIQQKSIVGIQRLLTTSPKTRDIIESLGGWTYVFKTMYPGLLSDDALAGLEQFKEHMVVVSGRENTSDPVFLVLVEINRKLRAMRDVLRHGPRMYNPKEVQDWLRTSLGRRNAIHPDGFRFMPYVSQLDATHVQIFLKEKLISGMPSTFVVDLLAQDEHNEWNPFEQFMHLPSILSVQGYAEQWFRSKGTDENAKGSLRAILGMLLSMTYKIKELSLPIGCQVCNTSNQDADMHQCKQCKAVVYCGKECQTKDWHDLHKYECLPLGMELIGGKRGRDEQGNELEGEEEEHVPPQANLWLVLPGDVAYLIAKKIRDYSLLIMIYRANAAFRFRMDNLHGGLGLWGLLLRDKYGITLDNKTRVTTQDVIRGPEGKLAYFAAVTLMHTVKGHHNRVYKLFPPASRSKEDMIDVTVSSYNDYEVTMSFNGAEAMESLVAIKRLIKPREEEEDSSSGDRDEYHSALSKHLYFYVRQWDKDPQYTVSNENLDKHQKVSEKRFIEFLYDLWRSDGYRWKIPDTTSVFKPVHGDADWEYFGDDGKQVNEDGTPHVPDHFSDMEDASSGGGAQSNASE